MSSGSGVSAASRALKPRTLETEPLKLEAIKPCKSPNPAPNQVTLKAHEPISAKRYKLSGRNHSMTGITCRVRCWRGDACLILNLREAPVASRLALDYGMLHADKRSP